MGYVIHTPADLSAEDRSDAETLGPPGVNADALPDALAHQADFVVQEFADVTDEFYQTCCAFNEGLEALEPALRAEDGDDVFESELLNKVTTREGIERQLLLRCLLVLRKP